MSNNIIRIDIKPTAGLFSIKVVVNSTEHDLAACDYADFSEDLEFAGLSIRGKPLCVWESKGPANISGFPLKFKPPGEDWVSITHYHWPVLIATGKPDVQLSFKRDSSSTSVEVFIPRACLPERFSLTKDNSIGENQFPGLKIIELDEVSHAAYFLQIFRQCQIVQSQYSINLVLPEYTTLCVQDWKKVKRHIFTGSYQAAFSSTVPEGHKEVLFFSGQSIQEVQGTHGIEGTPEVFESGALGFSSVRIIDASKAAKAYPVLANLGGKLLNVDQRFFLERKILMEDFIKNPRLIQAHQEIDVSPTLDRIRLSDIGNALPFVDYPIAFTDDRDDAVICPQHLLDRFFVSVRETARTCKVEGAVRYTVVYSADAREPGKWLLKTDALKLKLRNRCEEYQSRKARKTSLTAVYGRLPEGWEELNDEEVKLYFSIRERLAKGEIIAYQECALLPRQGWCHGETMKSWLSKQNKVVTCPISAVDYVPYYTSVDELAVIPGFWPMVEGMFGEKEFLRAIVTSQKVQALALTELL